MTEDHAWGDVFDRSPSGQRFLRVGDGVLMRSDRGTWLIDLKIPSKGGPITCKSRSASIARSIVLPMSSAVPGIDLPGVEDATTFLRRAKAALASGEQLTDFGSGTRVLVLGGGNTAMDVARTLRRFAAEAMTAEWMDERFSRVRPDELAEARAEGVDVRFSTTLERLDGDEAGVRVAWLRQVPVRRGFGAALNSLPTSRRLGVCFKTREFSSLERRLNDERAASIQH